MHLVSFTRCTYLNQHWNLPPRLDCADLIVTSLSGYVRDLFRVDVVCRCCRRRCRSG